MRGIPLIPLIPLIVLLACMAGGCASRLPVQDPGPVARGETTRPPWSAAALDETVARLDARASCFVRCAAEHAGMVEEVVEEEHLFHEVALFTGYTFERGEGGFTLGLDYGYWFTPRFAVGPFADFVFGEIDALALGAGVWFRPFRRAEDLAFYVAPGIDLANEEEEKEEGGTTRSWESAFLLRLGVTYAFELGHDFRLAPAFYVDVIFPDKAAYVLGLNLGKEF